MASRAPCVGLQNKPLAIQPCGHEPPGLCGFAAGKGLGKRSRRDEREHEGNGRFHWVDVCLGHYWDTAAVTLKSLRYLRQQFAASWDARRLARRLAYRVMIRPTGVPLSTRTFLGAPPTPSIRGE